MRDIIESIKEDLNEDDDHSSESSYSSDEEYDLTAEE
jgi:hypothetical protein